MLADVLERTRDQVAEELERRAASTESSERAIAGRRKRLTAFVQGVIDTLRSAAAAEAPQPNASFSDGALELQERQLVLDYLIEEIERKRLDATPRETALVGGWVSATDRSRLREQNVRLRALLDDVQESAALFGLDGRILYCNRTAYQQVRSALGVPRGEIVGRTPAELGMPGELVIGRPIKDLLPLARAHESFEVTAWGRAKEGRLAAVYGPDGAARAVALVCRDVQSRKLAETRLTLLTKLSTLAGIMDHDEVAEALVEVPLPELADWCAVTFVKDRRIRRTFLAQRDPAKAALRDAMLRDLPSWDRHPLWQEMLTTGFQLLTEVSDDLLRRLATTERQYALLSELGIRSMMVVPLVSRGQITGIITFAYTTESGRRYGRDDPPIAEEIALHAAHTFENTRLMKDLKASETRFHIALAGARTAVYEQDTSLRYVWTYNPLLSADVLGKTDADVLPADEAAVLTKAKRRVLEEGDRFHDEMGFTFRGEERRHFRETIEPLRDHAGKIVGVIGATTDITEQQRTQQQLSEELDFRERMMGIIGHDLRSPLNTVIMVADLLLHTPALAPSVRDHLLRLRRAAGRMQEMIDTLLDFTRARFLGRVPISRVPADLAEISRSAIDEMRVIWPDNAIELDVQGDAAGEWDPGRMAQTISNLVTNAISFGATGTPVRVHVEGDGAAVRLQVHNDGPPICADLLPVLFEPFRRGAPDRSPRGLGLGLYIVEQIVQGHDGTIAVASTQDQGTTITLRLPRFGAGVEAPAPAGATVH